MTVPSCLARFSETRFVEITELEKLAILTKIRTILFTNICGNLNVENFSIPKCHVYVLCESNSCYIEKFQISFLTSQGNKKKLTEKNEIQYLFSKCWKISTY